MALISIGEFRDYWKRIYDWINGSIASSPKVTVSNLSELDADGGLKVHVQNKNNDEQVLRKILVANTISIFLFNSTYNQFEILNIGEDDVYIDFGLDPAVDGEDSILIPANMGLSLTISKAEIRAISVGTPKLQIIGLK